MCTAKYFSMFSFASISNPIVSPIVSHQYLRRFYFICKFLKKYYTFFDLKPSRIILSTPVMENIFSIFHQSQRRASNFSQTYCTLAVFICKLLKKSCMFFDLEPFVIILSQWSLTSPIPLPIEIQISQKVCASSLKKKFKTKVGI